MRVYCTAFARGVCVNLNDMCRGTRHLRVFLVFDNRYCGVGRTAGQVWADAFGGGVRIGLRRLGGASSSENPHALSLSCVRRVAMRSRLNDLGRPVIGERRPPL